MKKDYSLLAKDIIIHIGGKNNINDVRHCITRLRFSLKDISKVDTDYLKSREGIVTIVEAMGQYQVVIGNHVPDVYHFILKEGIKGIGEIGVNENNTISKGNLFNRFVDLVSGIFQPFLGPLAAAGIIKGIVSIMAVNGFSLDNSALYTILNAAGDGFFQFLPILIAFTSARKFKMNEFTAVAIATSLVYPTLPMNITKLSEVGLSNILGIPFELPSSGSYLQTVMPAILAIWVASIIEKTMKKIVPDVVKLFLVPFITIIVTVPLTFLIVGPVANIASNLLSTSFTVLMDISPLLYGLLLGVLWQVMVMFGLHWAIVPLAILQFSQNGSTDILVPATLANFTQTGVLAAILLKSKEKKVKSLSIPALISSIFGVTEPAIYGITLPMKMPFYISCAVSGIIGIGLSFFNIKSYAFGALGIFQYPGYVSTDTGLMPMWIMIGFTALAIILSFIIQLLLPVPMLYRTESENKIIGNTNRESVLMNKKIQKELIVSPLLGKTVKLTDVPDQVFASGAMGKGIAIEPITGTVFSPVKGKVNILFPTNHAIGLITENDVEVLIHIGMDTVSLNGNGFESFVSIGENVEIGQKLLEFDIDILKELGLPVITPIIVTNTEKFEDVLTTIEENIKVGDNILTVVI